MKQTNKAKPKKPTTCILDADGLLFEAASTVGEQVWYIYKDKEGNEVARFDSAQKGKNWIDEIKFIGFDIEHGYEGDVDELTRHTEYEILDVRECYKAFKSGLKKIKKMTGCKEIVAYIGKATGAKVFRYDLATIYPYKKGRGDSRKPHHLEAVRKFARTLPEVKTVIGDVEVDDKVMEVAEKLGEKACLTFTDKDALQAVGCWVYHMGNHDKPVWSSPNIVGRIGKRDNGKTKMLGWLSLMYQMIKGDKSVDGIVGLPKYGDVKAYELLAEFDNKPMTYLPKVIDKVLAEYHSVYGDEHTYTHHNGVDEITASYKDIFMENFYLLYMRRYKNDDCPMVAYHVHQYNT